MKKKTLLYIYLSDETFKTVTNGPLKQGNNTETNTIIIF